MVLRLLSMSHMKGVKNGVRRAVKASAHTCATVLVAPALLSFALRSMVFGRNRALEGSTQALACLPGIFGEYLRRAFLQRVLRRCDSTAVIGFGTVFSQADACIDARVVVGPRCHIGLVHIERDVLIGPATHLLSGGRTHGISDPAVPIRDQAGDLRCVRIGAGAWIGSAVIVMADVGADTVVSAGSVVHQPLPARVVAGGVPARTLSQRRGPRPVEPMAEQAS